MRCSNRNPRLVYDVVSLPSAKESLKRNYSLVWTKSNQLNLAQARASYFRNRQNCIKAMLARTMRISNSSENAPLSTKLYRIVFSVPTGTGNLVKKKFNS
ncbi:hypothetical protein AAHA92_20175 [Salvia divinorum]|uniref:Uncharacterized protein n=1 Tax=Salvia divinorum TaxID=28513 RepID=A0ABD1GGC6_SALDI